MLLTVNGDDKREGYRKIPPLPRYVDQGLEGVGFDRVKQDAG
jgi:hypothetical protein